MSVLDPVRAVVVGLAVAAAALLSPVAQAAAHADAPTPTVSSVSPSSGSQAGGTTVDVAGTGFTGATVVDFGGQPASVFSVLSDTDISVISPASYGSGPMNVTVLTPGGRSASGSGDVFTYSPLPASTITAISPASGYQTGGTRVTITGTSFSTFGGNTVYFGSDGDVQVVSATATQIVVLSPASGFTGTVDVSVDTREADEGGTLARFTYLPVVPLLAVEGINKALYVSTNGGRFTSYGGALRGAPAVVSGNDRNYYIVRGTDNDLYVRDDRSAFTRLRPGSPLYCATAPAAFTVGNDEFVVGCVGRDGRLYVGVGTFPPTGNPTIGALRVEPGIYDTDSSAVPGGLSTNGQGDFILTGPAYGASGTTGITERPYPAGNTYAVQVDPATGASFDETFRIGGSCSGAPQAFFDFDAYVVCRGSRSAATFVVHVQYGGTADTTFVSSTDSYDVGGAAVGSPIAGIESNVIDVIVTGTTGRLYTAEVVENSSGPPLSSLGFQPTQLPCAAVSGPAVSVGAPPASTSQARRAHAKAWF